MTNALTVADIISDPSLDTRLLSGSRGLDRRVLWAHSCEMDDPAQWLGPHELLMTIGRCVPARSQDQRGFIARLDDAGLAGIVIGDDNVAPRLAKAMLQESEARGFPVLATGYNTPFAAIGRMVAAANAERQTMDVLLLAKLYKVAGGQDEDARRSGKPLRDLFRTDFQVIDDATGCVVVGDGVLGHTEWRSYPLQTQRPARLVVSAEAQLDGFSLVHLLQVLAVNTTAILQDTAEQIRSSAEMLDAALGGRQLDRLEARLARAENRTAYRAIVTACEVEQRIPLAIALSGLIPLATQSNGHTLLICPARDVEPVLRILNDLGVTAGISAEHHEVGDLRGAFDEASSEFSAANAAGERWREFRGERVSLLSRSRTESGQIVRTVLGPLVSDDPRYVPLRETLFALLDHDLRWKATAEAIGLHRQTLVYRLQQVEKLTGRSVRKTKDVSEFWLARTAWDQLQP